MSDRNRPSCSRCRDDAIPCGIKPRHVRSLNFGQSILELDTVEQCAVSNRVLVIDEKIVRIPCTEKTDYVRKWLETHENRSDSSQYPPPSPVGTSTTTAFQRSPILNSGRKQRRRTVRINRNATVERLSNADRQENCTMHPKPQYDEEKKWECKSEIQYTPPNVEKVAADETSPVIRVASHRNFKKRKRKLQYEEDGVSPKCPKSHEIKGNTRSMSKLDDNCNTLRTMPADQNKFDENVDTKAGILVFSTEVKKSPENYQGYIETFSSSTQEKLNFADSSSDNANKNDSKIETGTSNDSQSDRKDEKCYELASTPSSSNNLSNFIEDTDTQETGIKTSPFSVADNNCTPSEQPFTLQLINDDLNETYCSEAEMIQSTHLSTKISQVPSLNKTTQKTGSKSTQTEVNISSITTPSKKSPDWSMHAHLLDSGKKRRKPKKGSMVARLQSLVNAQVSDIRIWRYRMNKDHDTTSAQYISVLVRNFTKQFGNQFLEGVLLEDRYNLLQSDIQIEQAEVDNAQARSKEDLYKNITIMLVCDIIGTLKMISEVVINVYPPWNILDKDDLTLEVMHISMNNNYEIPDIENTGKSHKRKKRILKEFNCPCIEEQRELPFCSRKPSNDKPDVMRQIFNF